MSDDDITIHVTGTHGMAYIDMTAAMMKQFGVNNDIQSGYIYKINAGQKYNALTYNIEPDASASAYFYAMSPLLGIQVCVRGIHFDSLQGDIEFISTLEKMGCHSEDSEEGIILYPPEDGVIHGIDIDMSAFSDQAITLSAIAPFADSPTTITGIGHIRKQESDRLSGIEAELNKMGIKTETTEDSITIYPGSPKPSRVSTYEDHRMAMGFSLIGLRTPGIIIDNPGCCAKTFEKYFLVLDHVIHLLTAKN
jgi:3-phosphoshikimate 1-carboxyvinyltransferase